MTQIAVWSDALTSLDMTDCVALTSARSGHRPDSQATRFGSAHKVTPRVRCQMCSCAIRLLGVQPASRHCVSRPQQRWLSHADHRLPLQRCPSLNSRTSSSAALQALMGRADSGGSHSRRSIYTARGCWKTSSSAQTRRCRAAAASPRPCARSSTFSTGRRCALAPPLPWALPDRSDEKGCPL